MYANSIMKYRRLLKLRQSDLAEDLGVTRQTINAIENGKYLPNMELAFRLAKAFNCNIEDIFYINK
ncbi:MAG: helix-turn-helix transcriptional regulator [Nanoarchaeota archaeon]|nr:helix-turn-helix transcriptional regulator [Nanoarchaeota archaeon]